MSVQWKRKKQEEKEGKTSSSKFRGMIATQMMKLKKIETVQMASRPLEIMRYFLTTPLMMKMMMILMMMMMK